MQIVCRAYTQHVIHQCPSAWPDLHDLHARALSPLRHPLCDNPYADQFSEDLRDFGRGDEVSLLAKLIPAFCVGGVIAAFGRGKALAHICCDGNWTCCLYAPLAKTPSSDREEEERTVIASARLFANGVDHCRLSVVNHLAGHRGCRRTLRCLAHRPNSLTPY